MKQAQIIHNPSAGDAEHTKESLIASVEKCGYNAHYINTKNPAWEDFLSPDAEVHIVAGGDGTVRKLAKVLLEKSAANRKTPLLLLPLGTANNLTRSLGIDQYFINQLMELKDVEDFDCGRISGLKKYDFFIESMGTGIFPELIVKMEEGSEEFESSEEELDHTYEVLKELIRSYEPPELSLEIDGTKIKGKFLMAELMNIRFLGPNIELAPGASSNDSLLNLVLIPEKSREALLDYVESQQLGNTQHSLLNNIAEVYLSQNVSFLDLSEKLHVDDHIVQDPKSSVTASVASGVFKVCSTK